MADTKCTAAQNKRRPERFSSYLERARRKAAEQATSAVIRELFPLLDALENAIHSVPDYVEEIPRARFEYLHRDFLALLKRLGVVDW